MSENPAARVSVTKSAASTSGPASPSVPTPRLVLGAGVAAVVSGLAAIVAAASLFTGQLHVWILRNLIENNPSGKNYKTYEQLRDQVTAQQKGALISSIVVAIALGIAAAAAFRGRYWARWTILGLWVLATFTGTLAGLGSVVSITASVPGFFKFPAFVSGLSLVIAVLLINLRPSTEYLNLSRPAKGSAPTRRGLFAPREPVAGKQARPHAYRVKGENGTAPRAKSTGSTGSTRAKQRNDAEAIHRGAELARTRAKASKSRRTGA